MDIDERNSKSQGYSRFRSTMHLTMGAFYLMFGGVILYLKSFGNMDLSPVLAYSIGSMMLLYGVFRIWRGWTDMRNNRR